MCQMNKCSHDAQGAQVTTSSGNSSRIICFPKIFFSRKIFWDGKIWSSGTVSHSDWTTYIPVQKDPPPALTGLTFNWDYFVTKVGFNWECRVSGLDRIQCNYSSFNLVSNDLFFYSVSFSFYFSNVFPTLSSVSIRKFVSLFCFGRLPAQQPPPPPR